MVSVCNGATMNKVFIFILYSSINYLIIIPNYVLSEPRIDVRYQILWQKIYDLINNWQ